MSEENVARQAVRLRDRRHRSREEQVLVRIPALRRLLGRAFMRLSPRSHLRRVLVAHRIRQVYEAWERGDMDAFLALGNDPDVEVHTAKGADGVPLGADLEDTYYGYQGQLEFREQWLAAWDDFHLETEEVIDCGDRLVVLLRQRARGRGSGLEVEQRVAQIVSLGPAGMATQVKIFWDQGTALEAAGLGSSA